MPNVLTEHLRLVPSTATLAAAAHCSRTALGTLLEAHVDDTWPETTDAPNVEADMEVFFVWEVVCNPASAPWKWMIVHRADNALIGEIGTSNPPQGDPGEDSIQISYYLVPDYRGKGYMTEAARAYITWAFGDPRLTWIYATTAPDNVASRRVLEKLGARQLTDRIDESKNESGDDWVEWLDWEIRPEHLGPETSR